MVTMVTELIHVSRVQPGLSRRHGYGLLHWQIAKDALEGTPPSGKKARRNVSVS